MRNWGLLARVQGDPQVEEQKLRQALALFSELGLSPELEEVQADLRALGISTVDRKVEGTEVAASSEAVFFCYCREDSEFALQLAEDLKTGGVSVWIDQLSIPLGTRWDRAVENALNNCSRMLVILSRAAAKSNNIRDEICGELKKSAFEAHWARGPGTCCDWCLARP